jgi:5-methylcytosine-specific restriction endonuclease McrA
MEALWLILGISFVIYKLTSWNAESKRLKNFEQDRALRQSYIDEAEKENPDLAGKFWNPNRDPVARELRPSILARTKGRCFYCDCNLLELTEWQVDHVWPYRYGGSEDFINLVPSCKTCNEDKWSHLPPRYLLHKWVVGKELTVHERRFLEYYRNTSMANLIGTSAYWKGRANHWHETIFNRFVDLITLNEELKNTSGVRRDELKKEAEYIYRKLDCDIVFNRWEIDAIGKWLDWDMP